jgi:predicted P-loop ATPase
VRLFFVNEWQGNAYQPGLDNLLNATVTIAYARKFNPVLEYLDSLKWDCVPRVEKLFGRYFNCGEDDYTRAVSRCFMIGAVRRVRHPGCKFDTMPILKGSQGWNKSTGVKTLFGEEFWSDASLGNLRDKDAPLKLRGIWVQEFAEVDSLTRSETNVLKHFCSLQADRQRDPYGRIAENSPRRCVFIATVNEGGYLKDPTGARRFWPLDLSAPAKVTDLARDRDQLWAEAAKLEADGASDILPYALWNEASERAAEQTTEDPWADPIRLFLENRADAFDNWQPNDEGEPCLPPDRVHTSELYDAVGIRTEHQTKDKAQRLRTVMEATLGWRHAKAVRIGERNAAGYVTRVSEQ